MAVDYAIEILIDNTITGTTDKYAEIYRRVLQCLESDTTPQTLAAAYSAGSTSKNQVTLQVGGTATVGFAIRITVDETSYTSDKLATLVRRVIQCLESETLKISHSSTGAYVAGDRAYNSSIALS